MLLKLLHLCQQQPLATGIVCAGTKGALADVLSQLSKRDAEYNPTRTYAFAAWNALYCGLAVYGLYSVLLPRVWPTVLLSGARHPKASWHVAYSVAFDNAIATPLICLPTYYVAHTVVDSNWAERRRPLELASRAMRIYVEEARDVISLSWMLWVPIQTVTFSVVPVSLRTHFVAAASFATLTIMSRLQGKLEERRRSIPFD